MAGTTGRGGTTGQAGRGGTTGTAGASGRGGTTGMAGTTGRGGTTGQAGRGGTTGTAGRGGTTGTGGQAGATTGAGGTGPCAGMCSNPINVPLMTNSGGLGTGATCHEVVGMGQGMNCGNFVAPRTFTVNGTSINCVMAGNYSLPARRNGGYCMEASAGEYSYAYFSTF